VNIETAVVQDAERAGDVAGADPLDRTERKSQRVDLGGR